MFKLISKIKDFKKDADYYGIVEFVQRWPEKKSDLAAYLDEDDFLYDKVDSITYHYDNKNNIIVFDVVSKKDVFVDPETGEKKIGCHLGKEPDVEEAAKEYINSQISDGWGENGIMLMSHSTHEVRGVYLGAAELYHPSSLEECIDFDRCW